MARAGLARRVGIALGCAVALLLLVPVAAFGSGVLKNFSIPSEGMAPTLEKRDRIVAYMDGGADLGRGDVIVFAVGKSNYVQRVAAVPGDIVGLREGVVILNGRPVLQRFLKEERRPEALGAPTVRRLAEQFPGETQPHAILDMGPTEFDDVSERRVPPGHVFVLGDNRDRSADSRVPRANSGVELLPVADIKGHALLYTWPRAKMGNRVNP